MVIERPVLVQQHLILQGAESIFFMFAVVVAAAAPAAFKFFIALTVVLRFNVLQCPVPANLGIEA